MRGKKDMEEVLQHMLVQERGSNLHKTALPKLWTKTVKREV